MFAAGTIRRSGPGPVPFSRLLLIGIAGGLLSGLLGVGGGVIMVPMLVLWGGLGQRDAHATSLAAIIPISLAGAAVFAWAGKIEYPEAAALAVGAVVGSQIGAGLLVRTRERHLRLGFGLFLLVVAASIVIRP